MTERSFRARVLAREPLLGAFLTWPTEGVLELLALAGFDFAVVDTEHGYFNPESVERMVRAAEGAPLPVIVRVPSCLAAADTGRALDAGACGVSSPARSRTRPSAPPSNRSSTPRSASAASPASGRTATAASPSTTG